MLEIPDAKLLLVSLPDLLEVLLEHKLALRPDRVQRLPTLLNVALILDRHLVRALILKLVWRRLADIL